MIRWFAVSVALVSTAALAADPGTPLDRNVTMEVGDVAATQIALYFASGAVRQEFNAPVLALYDRTTKKIIITIVGQRDKVEGARQALDEFEKVIAPIKGLLQKERGIRLTDSNTTVVYMQRTGTGAAAQLKELLRLENGKFITP